MGNSHSPRLAYEAIKLNEILLRNHRPTCCLHYHHTTAFIDSGRRVMRGRAGRELPRTRIGEFADNSVPVVELTAPSFGETTPRGR
jgi:hypothetical protein